VKLNKKSIWSGLLSLVFVIILEYLFPLPNPVWFIPIFLLVGLATDSIKDKFYITCIYLKKEKSKKIFLFILAEFLLTIFIIFLDFKIWILIALYCSIFWLISGLMRTCIEATKYLYKSGENTH